MRFDKVLADELLIELYEKGYLLVPGDEYRRATAEEATILGHLHGLGLVQCGEGVQTLRHQTIYNLSKGLQSR